MLKSTILALIERITKLNNRDCIRHHLTGTRYFFIRIRIRIDSVHQGSVILELLIASVMWHQQDVGVSHTSITLVILP